MQRLQFNLILGALKERPYFITEGPGQELSCAPIVCLTGILHEHTQNLSIFFSEYIHKYVEAASLLVCCQMKK